MEGRAVGDGVEVAVGVRKVGFGPAAECFGQVFFHPKTAKSLDVPDYRQQADYDCGPDAVRCVCGFFGVGPDPNDEAAYIAALGTTEADGTPPAAIAAFLNRIGLDAQAKSDLEIRDLLAATQAGSPVLCCIQDYGTPGEEAQEESGHWVVVSGVELDGDQLVVRFQDPSAGPQSWPAHEWLAAWEDTDGVHDFVHFGIVVSRKSGGAAGFTTDGSEVHAEAALWDEAEFRKRAGRPSFLLELPNIRQLDTWECGAGMCAAVGRGFGVGPETMDEWVQALGTNDDTDENSGTRPSAMVSYLGQLGLDPVARREMTLDDLEASVRAGRPVITPIQEYGTPAEVVANKTGHYVGVVGREVGYVIVQDPSIDNAMAGQGDDHALGRMLISDEKFLEVWHDVGQGGELLVRFGISVGPGRSGTPLLLAPRKSAAAPEGVATGTPDSEQESGKPPEGQPPAPEGGDQLGSEGAGPTPNCLKRGCVHYLGFRSADDGERTIPVCKAFPGGIPAEIAYGTNLHNAPYPGDGGVTYEGPDQSGAAV